ncbi:MAG: tetratricopeptide repeat protein [Planctomycetia bacterium]|nr:tetratricopeptide repeat protein [Planctomycetia bacterium]
MLSRSRAFSTLPLCVALCCCAAAAGCGALRGNMAEGGDGATASVRGQSPGMPGGPGGMGPANHGFGESLDDGEYRPGLIEDWWERIKSLTRPKADERLARETFHRGDELFVQKKYDEAADEYLSAAARAPDSLVEEDAMFMAAECYFFADRYPDASDAYAELVKKYPNSRHLDKASSRFYLIARYWQELDRKEPRDDWNPNLFDKTRPWFYTRASAIANYRAVWLNDPNSPLADDSIIQTAATYFEKGKWLEADEYFSQLRRDHPTSKHVMHAYLLGYRAKLARYLGPQYDREPLDEAEKLIEALLTQFYDQLGEEREKVVQARAAVQAMQAEREWFMAEFYHGKGHYHAARVYYQKTIDRYPHTQFAELARKRIGEIATVQEDPGERFAWLDEYLPQGKPVPKPITAKRETGTTLR